MTVPTNFSSSPLLEFTAVEPAHCGYKHVKEAIKQMADNKSID